MWNENFAYATGYDETKQKYLGLEVGQRITPIISASSLLVKPDIAQQQIEKEIVPPTPPIIKPDPNRDDDDNIKPSLSPMPPLPLQPQLKQKRRFYGFVELDSERINRDACAIADEVLQHLISLVGANVKVTLEIEAEVESGIPENVIRTIRENCHTLKFDSQDFSED